MNRSNAPQRVQSFPFFGAEPVSDKLLQLRSLLLWRAVSFGGESRRIVARGNVALIIVQADPYRLARRRLQRQPICSQNTFMPRTSKPSAARSTNFASVQSVSPKINSCLSSARALSPNPQQEPASRQYGRAERRQPHPLLPHRRLPITTTRPPIRNRVRTNPPTQSRQLPRQLHLHPTNRRQIKSSQPALDLSTPSPANDNEASTMLPATSYPHFPRNLTSLHQHKHPVWISKTDRCDKFCTA